ncbi:hypothetical protein LINPERPRIM_LOCUS5547 [Linum perenne]
MSSSLPSSKSCSQSPGKHGSVNPPSTP